MEAPPPRSRSREASSSLAARNRRAVVERAYGTRRERAGWLAQRANLRLRVMAKGAMGLDASADRATLEGARGATSFPDLAAIPNRNPASG